MVMPRNTSRCCQKGPPMYRTTKKKLVKRVGVSAVIALGALATGAGVASAAPSSAKGTSATVASSRESAHATVPGPGSRCAPGAGGVVSALTSSSITVVDPSGTSTTFSISSATTVTKDRAIAAVSDLAVGDQVRITPTGAGSTTAQSIDIEQPSVMGTVTAVSGDTITVSGPNGTSETVVVSGATTYTKSGASATLADIAVGDVYKRQLAQDPEDSFSRRRLRARSFNNDRCRPAASLRPSSSQGRRGKARGDCR